MTKLLLECPNCSSKMNEQISKKNNVILDKCTKCGGIHLGKKEVTSFIKDYKILQEFRQQGLKKNLSSKEKSRNCPICLEHKMLKGRFASTNSTLDYCENCGGIFFDKGELAELVSAKFVGLTSLEYDYKKAQLLKQMSDGSGPEEPEEKTFVDKALIGLIIIMIIFLDWYYETGILEGILDI